MAELVIALDYPAADEALAMAASLRNEFADSGLWMKIGLELYTASGPKIVREIRDMGYKVFADLKFHDIPNTVRGAVRSAARAGADMVNVHAAGGIRMMQAALQGAEEGAESGGKRPLVLAVTVLTSLAAEDLPGPLNGMDPGALALDYARTCSEAGLDGVVCSAHEAAAIKQACGNGFACLTPGIRPASAEAGDQRRIMTPAQAVRTGSDYLVVGRPVTKAADPAGAVRSILAEMQA